MYVIRETVFTDNTVSSDKVGTDVLATIDIAHAAIDAIAADAEGTVLRTGGGRLAAETDGVVRTWTIERFGR